MSALPPGRPASSPRARLVALTALGYLLAVGGAWFVVTTGLDGVVEGLERASVRADLNRAESALFSRVRALRGVAVDLAKDRALPPEGPPGEPEDGRADLHLVLDASARPVWARLEPGGIDGAALAAAVLPVLTAHGDSPASGLLAVPGGTLLVATAPRDGGGAVVVARTLAEEVGTIGAATGLTVALASPGAAGDRPAFEPLGEQLVRGNRTIVGLDGRPASVVQVTGPRTVHEMAARMARAVILVFASLATIFSAIIALLADRLFASALAQRESEQLRSQVVEHSADGILLVSPHDLSVTQTNPAAAALLPGVGPGVSLADVTGLPADTLEARLAQLEQVGRVLLGEIGLEGPSGRRTLEFHTWRLDRAQGPLFAVSARDVTERRLADAAVRSVALRDPLTGLPNRASFLEQLARALGEASVSGRVLGVLFLDLDGFKEVNDVLGHEAADALLVEVGRRLQSCVRPVDFVARHGGDEFLVLLPDLPSADAASRTATRLLEAVAAPFPLDGQPVRVGASIGVACAPDDGTDASTLIERADLAMYKAKELGRGGWQSFDASLLDRARRAIALRRALTAGQEGEALVPVYLPQRDLRTGQVVAVQAAAHWRSAEGSVEHDAIVAFAEQAGLAAALTEWLLTRAAADLSRLGPAALRVCVPIAGRAGLDELAGRVRTLLAPGTLAAHQLELELTDEAMARDPARARARLEELARDGVALTLGRFGTPHGSFLGLRQLPVQRVKIDRALVEAAGQDPAGTALLTQLVQMAHGLGLSVGLCGVDTPAQLALARRLDCDLVQGRQVGYGLAAPTVSPTARERTSGAG